MAEALFPPSERSPDWEKAWAELEAACGAPASEKPIGPGDRVIFTELGGAWHLRSKAKLAGLVPGETYVVRDAFHGFDAWLAFEDWPGTFAASLFKRA
jgi:hypothetical protein